ncbi:MAG: hypothetical protein DRQ45_08720, partial [Gammaproteobacteria bacterium]
MLNDQLTYLDITPEDLTDQNKRYTLLSKSFDLMPLKPNLKEASTTGYHGHTPQFPNGLTKEQLLALPNDLKRNNPINFGINCNRFNKDDSNRLVVFDFDHSDFSSPLNTLDNFRSNFKISPIQTLLVKTPSEGYHLYFHVPAFLAEQLGITNRADISPDEYPKVDIRTKGGYVVAPGSFYDPAKDPKSKPSAKKGFYTIESQSPIAPLPLELIQLLSSINKNNNQSQLSQPNQPNLDHPNTIRNLNSKENLEMAQLLIETTAPAVEGQSGDTRTYNLANKLLDLSISDEAALNFMIKWNETCLPPWSYSDLEAKIRSASRSRTQPRGVDAPTPSIHNRYTIPSGEEVIDREPYMNFVRSLKSTDYRAETLSQLPLLVFKMVQGGKQVYLTPYINNKNPNYISFTTLNKGAFSDEYNFIPVPKDAANKPMAASVGDYLNLKNRVTTIRGLRFMPEHQDRMFVDGYLNTYCGPITKTLSDLQKESPSLLAKQAPQLFCDHIRDNVAAGNTLRYDWLMCRMAKKFQQPGWKPETFTILFSPEEGTGKSFVTGTLRALYGSSLMPMYSTARSFASNFNGMSESALEISFEEATFDDSMNNVIKNKSTEQHIVIEKKGQEAFSSKTYAGYWATTNSIYRLNLHSTNRRLALFKVQPNHEQDKAYFKQIQSALDANYGEGYSHLLEFFLNYEITMDPDKVLIDHTQFTETLSLDIESGAPWKHYLETNWWPEALYTGKIGLIDWPDKEHLIINKVHLSNEMSEGYKEVITANNLSRNYNIKAGFPKGYVPHLPSKSSDYF